MEEAELEIEEEDTDDEEEYIYNPLKLPLGWDGKPIPYWLYKLHGLNQEFKCEICGNYSYWGRRAFEKHFKEWRHQNNMRALGIPNNKNFYEITKIEDAVALWENMQVGVCFLWPYLDCEPGAFIQNIRAVCLPYRIGNIQQT